MDKCFTEKVFTESDARILMSNAVCYALLSLHDDKELQKQVDSILFNDVNDLFAKQVYIQTIMVNVNDGLINEYKEVNK